MEVAAKKAETTVFCLSSTRAGPEPEDVTRGEGARGQRNPLRGRMTKPDPILGRKLQI